MAESKKEDASTSKTQKKGSVSDEFGKEFLSSWKSMSVSEDDGLDFNKDTAPKGKKSAFNFDKLDMDFSLDGDFGKKMSSFKVDMSDLDFSSPPKKASKPKEKSTEETPSGKQGGKQSRFTFDFDFNELDSFDFGSSVMKEEKKSNKAADMKGFDSPGKQEKVQTASNKPIASIGLPEDSDTDKPPRSQHASTSKIEHLMGNIERFDSINSSPSTSTNFGNLSPSRSTAVSPEKEISVSAKETDQCSQPSEKTVSTEQNVRITVQDSSIQSVSMEGSAQEAGPDTQGEVCSSATEETSNPEEDLDVSVKLVELEPSPATHIPGPKSTTNECDKMLGNQSDSCMGDTPKDEFVQGDAAISDSSDGNFSQKMLHSTRPANGNKAKSKRLPLPLRSEPKDLQTMKEKGTGGIQSKYFNRSIETESQLNTQTITKDVSSVSMKKAENVLLNHADSKSETRSHQPVKEKGSCGIQSKYFNKSAETDSQLHPEFIPKKNCPVSDRKTENVLLTPADSKRKECTTNDAQAGNQKVDNSKSHELAVTKVVGIPIVLGNGKSGPNHEISAGFQVHSTRSPQRTVKSTTPQSLNSKLVSSIAAIRNSKSNYVEGNKLSPLHASQKTLETSSSKVSRLVTPKDASHSKALTEIQTLKHSERSITNHCTPAKIDQTVSVEKQGVLSPSMKRKLSEAPNAGPVTQYPLKRAILSPNQSRGFPEASERLDNKRLRSTENLLEGFHSSPVLVVPRDEPWKEIEVPLLMENDENVEKAEAYSKELDDICNMLKKKHEEAKELLVRAIVNHNNLLMLNHPIYEEKIRMVQKFAALMLSPGHRS